MSQNNLLPPFLRPGDEVTIISPAFSIDAGKAEYAVKLLGEWGLKVRTGSNLLKRSGPFAGTDQERLSDFREALADPDIKAIFCSRGGYGTMRIVEKVDFTVLRKQPKWIIGFSDITVIHMWVLKNPGIITLHAEMPLNYSNPSKTPETITTLRGALFDDYRGLQWNGPALRTGSAEGIVTGGNLSLLYALMGTPAEPETRGTILFIEDVGEQYYHLDRMMTSLRLSGRLANLAALIAGGFSDMEDTRDPWGVSAREIISEAVKDYGYPVAFDFPAGHINDNRAFYLGRKASVRIEEDNSELIYL